MIFRLNFGKDKRRAFWNSWATEFPHYFAKGAHLMSRRENLRGGACLFTHFSRINLPHPSIRHSIPPSRDFLPIFTLTYHNPSYLTFQVFTYLSTCLLPYQTPPHPSPNIYILPPALFSQSPNPITSYHHESHGPLSST